MNLVELPKQTYSRSYEATTDKGIHLDMRFSGGWLIVELHKNNEKPSITLLEQRISPLGYMDLLPEQICYLLGLTVKGKTIAHPTSELINRLNNNGRSRNFFDFCDNKLHWEQQFLTLLHRDIGEFTDIIQSTFPEAVLLQSDYNAAANKWRTRQISFIMDQDKSIFIGIGKTDFELSKLNTETTAPPSRLQEFPFQISIDQYYSNLDPNGIGHLEQQLKKFPERKDKIDLNRIRLVRYRISTSIYNDDKYARECLEKILKISGNYFYDNFEAYDLENKERILKTDEYQLPWISHNLYKWVHELDDSFSTHREPRYCYFTVKYESVQNPSHFIGFKPIDKKTIPTKIEPYGFE